MSQQSLVSFSSFTMQTFSSVNCDQTRSHTNHVTKKLSFLLDVLQEINVEDDDDEVILWVESKDQTLEITLGNTMRLSKEFTKKCQVLNETLEKDYQKFKHSPDNLIVVSDSDKQEEEFRCSFNSGDGFNASKDQILEKIVNADHMFMELIRFEEDPIVLFDYEFADVSSLQNLQELSNNENVN